MSKVLIVISGKKGSGKNTLSKQLNNFLKKVPSVTKPKVKEFAYANKFKEHLIDFFGLNRNIVYGTDEQKNEFTEYFWENMVGNHGKTGQITYREFMQYWGTEVCRSLDPNIHVKNCCIDIALWFCKYPKETTQFAIITDARFKNEILTKDLGFDCQDLFEDFFVLNVRLTRNPNGGNDTHRSETELDNSNDLFDLIIPENATKKEQLQLVVEKLSEIGKL